MGGQTWYFEDDLPNTADPKEKDGIGVLQEDRNITP